MTPAPDALDARCCALAETCGLTPRECDVLRLLARGRSRLRIGIELGIADDTVKTHVKHLYRKAGVVSKQHLLDRLETMPDSLSA